MKKDTMKKDTVLEGLYQAYENLVVRAHRAIDDMLVIAGHIATRLSPFQVGDVVYSPGRFKGACFRVIAVEPAGDRRVYNEKGKINLPTFVVRVTRINKNGTLSKIKSHTFYMWYLDVHKWKRHAERKED